MLLIFPFPLVSVPVFPFELLLYIARSKYRKKFPVFYSVTLWLPAAKNSSYKEVLLPLQWSAHFCSDGMAHKHSSQQLELEYTQGRLNFERILLSAENKQQTLPPETLQYTHWKS